MKRIFVTLAAVAALATLCAAAAEAQLARSFVSGLGSDTNACTRLAPCRTFAVAAPVLAHGNSLSLRI